ncbi:DUF3105 domain-containing protein [Ornithinimicrobium panacihumi]|uniref:DUF3105 domain-containing protein n=1 Tax=Ornithinimicrobium panacihumi TaxID=2008449 RepID=UPI003F8B0DA5
MPRPDRNTPGDRASKVAQIQKANASAERRRGLMIWGSAALVVALIVGGITWAIIKDSPALADLSGVKSYEYEAAAHRAEPIEYTENPPVGGPHHDAWWNCGVYDEEIPDEHAVHSLEHGAVWLTYQPDLPAEQIEVLKKLGEQDYMLVSPKADQDTPVAASSWGNQLKLDSADEKVLTAYVREFKQNPETTPEFGAACSSGTSTDLVPRS